MNHEFHKMRFMKINALMFSINLSTYIFCINKLAYACFNFKSFILQLKEHAKCIEKLVLSMYHGPPLLVFTRMAPVRWVLIQFKPELSQGRCP